MTFIRAILLFFYTSAVYSRSFAESSNFKSALIGPEYCGQGPVVWCSDFTTAAECHAIKHCIQSVWLTNELPFSSESCDSCKSKLSQLRLGISSKSLKESVQKLLQNICDVTNTEAFQKRCEKYVNQYISKYFDELSEVLASDIDPVITCHILQLCVDVKPLITTLAPALQDSSAGKDVVVRFENIILHFPAENFLSMKESQQLIGSSKCTWGPSYWCNDLPSSKECKATTHCIENVWSKQEFTNDDDDICQLCKDTVKTARDAVTNKKTQDTLLSIFKSSCKIIPIQEVRKDCLNLTSDFVNELIQILASELDPIAVCTVIKLCHNSRIDDLLALSPKTSPETTLDLCVNCTAGMLSVQNFLKAASQKSLLDILLRVCNILSSFSNICSTLISSNIARIYEEITKETYPFPLCHLNGMCATQYHLHVKSDTDFEVQRKAEHMLTFGDQNLPCDLCKQFVDSVKNTLTVNTTENEFREMLEGVCRQINQYQKDCLLIVDDYFDLFYKYLTEELNSSELCREVKLCPRGNIVSDEGLNLLTGLVDSSNTPVTEVVFDKSVANVECVLCKSIIKVVQKEIDNPKYEHNIEKLLKEICSLVPKVERAKCNNFIQEYSDVLIKILATETHPDVVCSMIHVCTDVQPIEIELCPLCRDIMNVIRDKLEDPKDLVKIKHFLEGVCRYMPKHELESCKTFMDNYSELICNVLGEEADPKLVCPALKLCPNFLSPIKRCDQCQHLMNKVLNGLKNNVSESNIVDALHSLFLHDDGMTLTALQLKVNYHDDIVDMMNADFDAQESCVFLDFCKADMISNKAIVEVDETELEVNPNNEMPDDVCELCELVVNSFENELTSNATENEIKDMLEEFCSKFGLPVQRSNCSHFIMKHVQELLIQLKEGANPKNVCRMVNICPLLIDTIMNTDEANECELCEAVVGYSRVLRTNANMVPQIVAEPCDMFDGNTQKQCKQIISSVMSELAPVTLGIPSWYYCSRINMCPYGAHLTFKRVCIKTSELCVDLKRALLCDKLSYCQKHVWKSDKPSL